MNDERTALIAKAREIDAEGFAHKVANRELDTGEPYVGNDLELAVARQITAAENWRQYRRLIHSDNWPS